MVAPHERGKPFARHHLKAALSFLLFDHAIERERGRYAFQVWSPRSSHPNKPSTRRYVAALIITSSGCGLPLDASGKVGRLAQGQDLAFFTAADFADDD